VRRWISESRRTDNALTSIPAFLPVNLPAPSTVANSKPHNNIEIPHVSGAVPYAYLKDVLTRLPRHKNAIEELPHNWKPATKV